MIEEPKLEVIVDKFGHETYRMSHDGVLLDKEQAEYVAERIKRLEQENAKLRNLMQRRVKDYMYESCGDCWGGLCDECQCWVSECLDELRELGIEVEE